MPLNLFIRVARFSYELIIERCLPMGRALINPCYNFLFRNRETEALVNYNSGVVTIYVKPEFVDAINISSSECADDESDIHSVEICPCALSKSDHEPEYAQRSCVVEMAPEPQDAPPIPVEIGSATEIPIETPGDLKAKRLSLRTRRVREWCSAQRARRFYWISSPSTSSSTIIQSNSAAHFSQSIPYPDWMNFENEQINAWINNIVFTTGCRRGVAINALFRCDFDFNKALAFVESCIDQ